MTNEKKATAISYLIERIFVSELVFHESYARYKKPTTEVVIKHNIVFSAEHNNFSVTIFAAFNDDKNEIELGRIKCTSVFSVDNLSQYIEDKTLKIPDMFLINIASVSFSHTRAIMSQYANGMFILPMINPVAFFGTSIKDSVILAEQQEKNKD